MLIKEGFVDKTHAQRQARMDRAKREAQAAMKDLAEQRRAAGAKPGRGRVGGVHYDALMNAVQNYGPEVLTPAAKGFWEDQKRRHPWMCADGVVPGTDSANGHACRQGKVRERMVGGKWYHWSERAGGWIEGEVIPRKGWK